MQRAGAGRRPISRGEERERGREREREREKNIVSNMIP